MAVLAAAAREREGLGERERESRTEEREIAREVGGSGRTIGGVGGWRGPGQEGSHHRFRRCSDRPSPPCLQWKKGQGR